MIEAEKFIAAAEEIAAEEPAYKQGHSGNDGYCDCIGLIIGAIERCGEKWDGIHGSNWAARNATESLSRITGTGDLQPGEAVYKAYEPTDPKWNLPERYRESRDQRDYYHVGIVVSVYPLRIRHMTTPSPKMDTSIGKWGWHGKLKKIKAAGSAGTGSAEKEETGMETVIIAGGDISKPIHMRKAASTGSAIVADIPQGTTVEIIEGGGMWNCVKFGNLTGYVMAKFVQHGNGGIGTEEMITVCRADLEKAYDIIGDLLGLRG